MEVTIATRNRLKVDRLHNLRDPVQVENEHHIDPSGEHETWFDIEHSRAYEKSLAKHGLNLMQSRKEKTENG